MRLLPTMAFVVMAACPATSPSSTESVDANVDSGPAAAQGVRRAIVIDTHTLLGIETIELLIGEETFALDPSSMRKPRMAFETFDGAMPERLGLNIDERLVGEFIGSPAIPSGAIIRIVTGSPMAGRPGYSVSIARDLGCTDGASCGVVELGTSDTETETDTFEVPSDLEAFDAPPAAANARSCTTDGDCVGWRPEGASTTACLASRCHSGTCVAPQLDVGDFCREKGCDRGICGPDGCEVQVSCCVTTADCAPGHVCHDTQCWAEGEPTSWQFPAPATLLTNVQYAVDCCFDLGGDDSGPDSFIGALVRSLAESVDGFSTVVPGGQLVLVYRGLGTSDVDIVAVHVEDQDPLPTITLGPEAFVPGSDAGRLGFENATFDQGVLDAEQGRMRLPSSYLEGCTGYSGGNQTFRLPLTMPFQQARMAADGVISSEGGLDLANGRLTMTVPMTQVVATLNNTIAAACPEWASEGAIYRLSGANTLSCTAPDRTSSCNSSLACPDTPPTVCECPCVHGNFYFLPDIDTDGDGITDSLSVSVTFDGVATTVDYTP